MAVAIAVLGLTRGVSAGEEDDLQREIETQRSGMSDLERLDDQRANSDEITMLRSWLDEAWSLRSKHEYDLVRAVLDRCNAQAELIRQRSTAAKLRAQVQRREAALKEMRAKIASARKALQDTTIKKKALEGSAQ
jgi:predicted  nucleic acid-binding Zn-ribbon protein